MAQLQVFMLLSSGKSCGQQRKEYGWQQLAIFVPLLATPSTQHILPINFGHCRLSSRRRHKSCAEGAFLSADV
jgi:hypothetical protein